MITSSNAVKPLIVRYEREIPHTSAAGRVEYDRERMVVVQNGLPVVLDNRRRAGGTTATAVRRETSDEG